MSKSASYMTNGAGPDQTAPKIKLLFRAVWLWSTLFANAMSVIIFCLEEIGSTPQPLYNTIVGIHSINRVISKQKCIDYIEK